MAVPTRKVRAAVVVVGTKLVCGKVPDENGPWISARLGELGLAVSHVVGVGDDAGDVRQALRMLVETGVDLIVMTGGLGPRHDDVTMQVTGDLMGQSLRHDLGLEQRIRAYLGARPSLPIWESPPVIAGFRKQASIPAGAIVLPLVGVVAGVVIPAGRAVSGSGDAAPEAATESGVVEPEFWDAEPAADAAEVDDKGEAVDAAIEADVAAPDAGGTAAELGRAEPSTGDFRLPVMLLLPGDPKVVHMLWSEAARTGPIEALLRRAGSRQKQELRIVGTTSDFTQALHEIGLEITLGALDIDVRQEGLELRVTISFQAEDGAVCVAFVEQVRSRYKTALYSVDGRTAREIVEQLLSGRTVAIADAATSGAFTPSNGALPGLRTAALLSPEQVSDMSRGVHPDALASHGLSAVEVALVMATRAKDAYETDIAIGISPITTPGNDGQRVSVVVVWGNAVVERIVRLPRGRHKQRDCIGRKERDCIVHHTLHLLRELLQRS